MADLKALMESDLLDENEKVSIEAVLTTAVQDKFEETDAIGASGGSAVGNARN